MNNQTVDKMNEYITAAESMEAETAFFERLRVKLEKEVNALAAMSAEEQIKYAAETRAFLVEVQEQVNVAFEAINTQQKTLELLILNVNALVNKNKVSDIATLSPIKWNR